MEGYSKKLLFIGLCVFGAFAQPVMAMHRAQRLMGHLGTYAQSNPAPVVPQKPEAEENPKESSFLNKVVVQPGIPSLWQLLAAGQALTPHQKQELYIQDCNVWAKEMHATILPHKPNNQTALFATYNVHFWCDPRSKDPYSNNNYQAIVDTIARTHADVLVLQEFLLFTSADGTITPAKIYHDLEAMGYAYRSFYSTHEFKPGHPFGTMVVSKYPFAKEPMRKPFEMDKAVREKRGFVHALIQLPQNNVVSLYGTHLDVWDETEQYRKAEVDELMWWVARDPVKSICILADYNAVREQDYQYTVGGKKVWDLLVADDCARVPVIKEMGRTPTMTLDLLKQHGFDDCFTRQKIAGPKFTSWPGKTVDFIQLNKAWDLKIITSYVVPSAASDHCPVCMVVSLEKELPAPAAVAAGPAVSNPNHVIAINPVDQQTLFDAAHGGDLERVAALVKSNKVDFNGKNVHGYTAMNLAALEKRWPVVVFLAQQGADVNVPDRAGNTALLLAAFDGKWDVVRLLRERGADIHAKNYKGKSLFAEFIHATYMGDLSTVIAIVQNGLFSQVDVNTRDMYGYTALNHAALQGHWHVAKWLIEHAKADVNATDTMGTAVTYLAALDERWDIVDICINHGANIYLKNNFGRAFTDFKPGDNRARDVIKKEVAAMWQEVIGPYALFHAARTGNFDKVKKLVTQGKFYINARDKNGHSAAFLAALMSHWHIVKWLIERAKADPNTQDNFGSTILLFAVDEGRKDMVKFLLEHNADIRLRNNKGRAPEDQPWVKELAETIKASRKA